MKMQSILSYKSKINYFTIGWHPTFWCNYKCSYCNSNKKEFTSENTLVRIAEQINLFIKEKVNTSYKIFLKLLGGEICFYNWIKILEKIDKIDYLSFTTNFSNDNDYFKELIIYLNKRKISYTIMCSKHEENLNFDIKIIELINWCKQKNYKPPVLRLMVDNNFNLNEYYSFLEKGINPNLTLIRDKNNKVIELPDNIKTFMKKYNSNKKGGRYSVLLNDNTTLDVINGIDLINKLEHSIDTNNYKCSCTQNVIFIKPNGDIVGSECLYLRNKVIGNIFDLNSINLSNTPILCKVNDISQETYYCTLCWNNNLYKE